MKTGIIIGAAIVATLSACATPPERISGVANAGPCTMQDRQRLAILSNKQTKTANSDALGVFLIGLPVGSMGGGDNEAEIAILKGRCEGRPTTAGRWVEQAPPSQGSAPPPGTVIARP